MKFKLLLFPFIFCSTVALHSHNFIESITIEGSTITYAVNKAFHDVYLRENLFVTYENDIDLSCLDYSILVMPLIMNTISMIWISGQEYYIDYMDKDLAHSLEIIHEVYKRFYPATQWNGRLIAHMLVDNSTKRKEHKKAGIVLPFSHGLDSLCTSLLHRETPQLLVTVRGCPDTPIGSWDKNWRKTQKTIIHYANLYGHETTQLFSNFHSFFNWKYLCHLSPEITNWRLDTVEDLGWIGLAAPIVVSKGYTQFMVASNEDWSTPHPGASCPLINDSVSFAGVSVVTDAFDISRPEKSKAIANICNEHHLEKPKIFVCEHVLDSRKNCGECQKCVITMLAFLLAGENPRDYGFNYTIPHFLNYVKDTYFYENLYSLPRACWFKSLQHEARTKLNNLDKELRKFFEWFITIDFDQLTLPSKQIEIDYDAFRDVWNGIPDNWKEYRNVLQKTHIPGLIPISTYRTIWQNKEMQKKEARSTKKAYERRIKKRDSEECT